MLMADDGSEFWTRGGFSAVDDDDCDFFGGGGGGEDLSIDINTLLDILGEDPQPSSSQLQLQVFNSIQFNCVVSFWYLKKKP